MGREFCQMTTELEKEFYCDYYDFGFIKCHQVKKCPDGLDEDEDWEEENDF